MYGHRIRFSMRLRTLSEFFKRREPIVGEFVTFPGTNKASSFQREHVCDCILYARNHIESNMTLSRVALDVQQSDPELGQIVRVVTLCSFTSWWWWTERCPTEQTVHRSPFEFGPS